MTAKKTNKNNPDDIKAASLNLLLNVMMFVLFAVVIYLLYSMVLKFTGSSDEAETAKKLGQPSEIIQVEVLNGCGVSGVADRFTDFLRRKKIDVVNVDNYISFDVEHTLVLDRTGNEANAFKVASELGIANKYIVKQINKDYFLDVSIVIGKDYYKLKPLKTGE